MRYNFYSSDSTSLSTSSAAAAVAGPRSEDDKVIFYLAFRGRRKQVLLVKVLAKDEEGVKQLVSKLGERGLHPHLIHSKPAPPSSKKVPGRLWCPYCREWREFAANQGGYTTCEVCGVSDMDYHTRRYNHLWKYNSRSRR